MSKFFWFIPEDIGRSEPVEIGDDRVFFIGSDSFRYKEHLKGKFVPLSDPAPQQGAPADGEGDSQTNTRIVCGKCGTVLVPRR